MPTYKFKCNKCGNEFEVFASISEKNKIKCSKCKTPNITQIFTPLLIKGSKSSSSCNTCKIPTCSTCSLKE